MAITYSPSPKFQQTPWGRKVLFFLSRPKTRNRSGDWVLDRNIPHLDAAEIGRDRAHWRPISREMALGGWRNRPVAVIHRGLGRDTATLFQPSNRFFRTDGPYLYDGLRYFLYTGHFEPLGLKKSLGMASKPPETEFEPMDAFDMGTGEFLSLGSPVKKSPEKLPEKRPIEFPLASSSAAPAVGISAAIIGASPEIKFTVPEVNAPPMQIPEAAVPEFDDSLDQVQTLPILKAAETLDAVIVSRPLDLRLTNSKGAPLPKTVFKATFPDGTEQSGESDAEGFIRFPDNTQEGDLLFSLPDLGAEV